MPQASDVRRARMAQWFPTGRDGCINRSGTDDGAPARFLLARGWTEEAGMWSKPTQSYNPSIYEVECLLFLRDEWDYDWYKPLYPEPFDD